MLRLYGVIAYKYISKVWLKNMKDYLPSHSLLENILWNKKFMYIVYLENFNQFSVCHFAEVWINGDGFLFFLLSYIFRINLKYPFSHKRTCRKKDKKFVCDTNSISIIYLRTKNGFLFNFLIEIGREWLHLLLMVYTFSINTLK